MNCGPVKAFWADITDANRPDKYFMGPIVVLEKPDDGLSELLDGQQRLATVTILFAVIRDAASKLGYDEAKHFAGYIQRDFIISEEGRRNIQLGETDDTYFRESVQQLPGEQPLKKPKKRSHRFIFEARPFLADSVSKALSGKDGAESLEYLKVLRDYVRHSLILACITVSSDDDAFQIFETLNDRGLRLSTPDLLLNFLMRQAKDEERKHIRQISSTYISRSPTTFPQRALKRSASEVFSPYSSCACPPLAHFPCHRSNRASFPRL